MKIIVLAGAHEVLPLQLIGMADVVIQGIVKTKERDPFDMRSTLDVLKIACFQSEGR